MFPRARKRDRRRRGDALAATSPTRPSPTPRRRCWWPSAAPTGTARTYATPATNQQVAGEVYLSVDAVKTHLRTLFAKFGVEDLPQNQKRVKLVELALQSGAITPRDLT